MTPTRNHTTGIYHGQNSEESCQISVNNSAPCRSSRQLRQHPRKWSHLGHPSGNVTPGGSLGRARRHHLQRESMDTHNGKVRNAATLTREAAVDTAHVVVLRRLAESRPTIARIGGAVYCVPADPRHPTPTCPGNQHERRVEGPNAATVNPRGRGGASLSCLAENHNAQHR